MDTLTLSLIALGVVAVGAVGFLMYKEFRSMQAAKKARSSSLPLPRRSHARSEPRVEVQQPARDNVSQGSDQVDALKLEPDAKPEPEPAPAKPEESPAEKPAAAKRKPARTGTKAAGKSRPKAGEASALARLSIMPAAFDREAAIAVAGSPDAVVDGLLESDRFEFDETVGLYEWTEAARTEAAQNLTLGDRLDARTHHVVRLTEAARATIHTQPGAQPAPEKGWEISEHDLPHFRAAFDFLVETPDMEQRLLDLVDAIALGGGFRFGTQDAIRWLGAAVAAAKKLDNRKSEQEALFALGGAYADSGEHQKSLESYEAAAEAARELEDRHFEGRTIGNIGLALHRMGKSEEAIERLTEAKEIMTETGDRQREALALAGMADVAIESGDFAKAIEVSQEHLDLVNQINDKRGQIMALAGLGRAHHKAGDNDAAAEFFEKQLSLSRLVRDLPSEGNALGNLGDVYREIADHEKEVECYVRQVEVANLFDNADAGVHAMGHLGRAHQAAGRSSVALDWFEQQLKLSRQIEDRAGEAESLWNAALVVHSRGQTADAITRASAALMIYDEIESPEAEKLREEIARWRG